MKIEDIKKGMEIRCLHRKLAFTCDVIDLDAGLISGRTIKKDGCIGKRILKEKAVNVYSAQSVITGFERIQSSTGNSQEIKKEETCSEAQEL